MIHIDPLVSPQVKAGTKTWWQGSDTPSACDHSWPNKLQENPMNILYTIQYINIIYMIYIYMIYIYICVCYVYIYNIISAIHKLSLTLQLEGFVLISQHWIQFMGKAVATGAATMSMDHVPSNGWIRRWDTLKLWSRKDFFQDEMVVKCRNPTSESNKSEDSKGYWACAYWERNLLLVMLCHCHFDAAAITSHSWLGSKKTCNTQKLGCCEKGNSWYRLVN